MLINTAKDLLKQDGCELFGRFFISLLAQAAQERSAIPEDRRRSTFVYIDEAQDYFDEAARTCSTRRANTRSGWCSRTKISASSAMAGRRGHGLDRDQARRRGLGQRCGDTRAGYALRARQPARNAKTSGIDGLRLLHEKRDAPACSPHRALWSDGGAPRMSEAEHQALIEENRQRVASGDPRQGEDADLDTVASGGDCRAGAPVDGRETAQEAAGGMQPVSEGDAVSPTQARYRTVVRG